MSVATARPGVANALGERARWLVIGLIAVAVVLRLVLAIVTRGNGDIDNELRAANWLVASPLHFYSRESVGNPVWPDLSGYFPVVLIARALHISLGIAFKFLVRLPVIAANLFLAWLIDSELRRREVGTRPRVVALITLLFSPLLVFESGWHAQLDLVSVAFAAAAFVVWERAEGDRRAVGAGALIAIAGLIKPIPAVALIALLPHVRSRRELLLLLGSAAAVLAIGIAPWAINEWHALTNRLDYQGVPGLGGLSLLAQPNLATVWLNAHHVAFNAVEYRLLAHARTITLIVLGISSLWVLLRRPPAAVGAVMLFTGIYASATSLSLQYLIWVLPFIFLAGWIWTACAFQAILIVPVLLVYIPGLRGTLGTGSSSFPTALTYALYVPIMDALAIAFIVAWVVLAIRSSPRRAVGAL